MCTGLWVLLKHGWPTIQHCVWKHPVQTQTERWSGCCCSDNMLLSLRLQYRHGVNIFLYRYGNAWAWRVPWGRLSVKLFPSTPWRKRERKHCVAYEDTTLENWSLFSKEQDFMPLCSIFPFSLPFEWKAWRFGCETARLFPRYAALGFKCWRGSIIVILSAFKYNQILPQWVISLHTWNSEVISEQYNTSATASSPKTLIYSIRAASVFAVMIHASHLHHFPHRSIYVVWNQSKAIGSNKKKCR